MTSLHLTLQHLQKSLGALLMASLQLLFGTLHSSVRRFQILGDQYIVSYSETLSCFQLQDYTELSIPIPTFTVINIEFSVLNCNFYNLVTDMMIFYPKESEG